MNRILRGKKGFTLVELAIVMVIVGLIIGIGAGMVGPLTKKVKRDETKETINANMESVISYATSSKRLPVWRDANDAVTASNEFHYLLRNRNDAWGNPLFYTYDGALFNNDICGKKTTALSIVQCADSACTPATQVIINNIAFIVYSRGENVNYQTILPGGSADAPVPVPSPVIAYVYPTDVTMNADRVSGNISIPNTQPLLTINDPADNGCVPTVPPDPRCMYDDIVKWVTLDELRTKIGCQGAQLQILNNEIPFTSLGSSYTANVFAAGGIPNIVGLQSQYRWCVEIRNRTAAQGLPNGITFNPNFVRYPNDPTPTYCSDQVEVAWPAWASNLVITKTTGSTESGSFNVTVFARDNNNSGNDAACNAVNNSDSCTQKSFVLTINP